jgi:hypothetical protein
LKLRALTYYWRQLRKRNRMSNQCWSIGLAATLLQAAGALHAASSDAAAENASWQPHHVQFDFYGITSRYTCDGLEGKVRQILLYLGARSDATVRATGCPGGSNSISRNAWVTADFSTLNTAAANPPTASSSSAASWTPLKIAANRPYFMGDGDCELIDQMRKVLTDNFSWRGQVMINTRCIPYSTSIHDYEIQGEVLKANATLKGQHSN